MKKNTLAIIAIIVAVIALVVAVTDKDSSNTTVLTTQETVKVSEETEADITTLFEEGTELYKNSELFKEIEISDSDLPFDVEGINIKTAKLYIPLQHIGDEDVWENSYIVIECDRTSKNVCCKFEGKGIHTGNIVAKEDINLTAIYIDGRYSENYSIGKDGKMVYISNFPSDAKEVGINNKSAFPIFSGEIAGEDVVVDNITIKF